MHGGGLAEPKIPSWANACACVERIFSLLKQFNEQQQSALEDYINSSYDAIQQLVTYTILNMLMFFSYYAPLCLYALTSYYARNYASIIRQGLLRDNVT